MQTEITPGLRSVLWLGWLIDVGDWPLEAISLTKRNNCGEAVTCVM